MLYEALRQLLVDEGPLANLFALRLPPRQVDAVDTAFVPLAGTGPQRTFGKRAVIGGPTGVTDDGGVAWYHSGVQLQMRARDPDEALAAYDMANEARDMLAQLTAPTSRDMEEIIRVDITISPRFLSQDERGRVVISATYEVWHRPFRVMSGGAFTEAFTRGFDRAVA